MSKRQLIDEIRTLNTTAEVQFLAQFDDTALKEYLDHLQAAQDRRLRIGGWVKRRQSREKMRMAS
jgi:hypothetical protein